MTGTKIIGIVICAVLVAVGLLGVFAYMKKRK